MIFSEFNDLRNLEGLPLLCVALKNRDIGELRTQISGKLSAIDFAHNNFLKAREYVTRVARERVNIVETSRNRSLP